MAIDPLYRFDAGGDYLRPRDLLIDQEYREFRLIIKRIHPEGSHTGKDGEVIKFPVLEFEKCAKKLIVKKTSQSILHLITGTQDGLKLPGRPVRIGARKVPCGKKMEIGLRILPAKGMILDPRITKNLGVPAQFEGDSLLPEEKCYDPDTGKEEASKPQPS